MRKDPKQLHLCSKSPDIHASGAAAPSPRLAPDSADSTATAPAWLQPPSSPIRYRAWVELQRANVLRRLDMDRPPSGQQYLASWLDIFDAKLDELDMRGVKVPPGFGFQEGQR